MKKDIIIPRMGESILEAVIGNIIKPSGSSVVMDEEILELETDKVNQVLYAPAAGQITLTVKPQEKVNIGQVVGYVEDVLQVLEIKEEKTALAQTLKPIMADATARRETRKKLSKIRQVIAERLVKAQHTAAMLTTFNEVDLTQVIALRQHYKEDFAKEYHVKLGYMPFFVKAAVSALQAFPEVNAYLDGDDLVYRHYFDIGIAVSSERGLVVPVVRHCDQLSFAQIEQGIAHFSKKAADGLITLEDLQGGGFTITNGGVFGSLLSTPIINPPQSAILGMHKIMKRPMAIDDQVVIRPMMYLALTYDHRVLDGKEAVSFLVHVKDCLEDPARLLLEI
jgi:2-oxoglutarate dehydrogenase E2 component (dihydrolipoamide succinyltransferase)